jgi:hypothetical protein
MRDETGTPEDSSAAMMTSTPPWHVLSVKVISPGKIEVVFNDSLRGVADLSELIRSEDAGVFAALRDATVFAQSYVDYGAVTWPGEIDLAPDALHARIKAQGSAALV